MYGILYDLIYVLIHTLAASLCAWSLSNQVAGRSIYAAIVFWSAVFVIVQRQKVRGRILLVGISAAVAAGFWWIGGHKAIEVFVKEQLWVAVIAAIALLMALLQRGARNHEWMKAICPAAAVIMLAYMLIEEIKLVKPAALALMLCIVVSGVESTQKRWNKEGDTDVQAHTVLVFPFVLALFAMLYTLPAPDHPYEWKLTRNLTKDLRSTYERIIQSVDPHLSWGEGEGVVGFSDDARFYGSVGSSAYEVFEIENIASEGMHIPLSGKSFDTFTGRAWIKHDSSDAEYRLYDLIETMTAVIENDPDNTNDYMRSAGLTIHYRGIGTSHVFVPLKSWPLPTGKSALSVGGDLHFSRQRYRDYSINFLRLNRSYEEFAALASRNRKGTLPDSETVQKAIRTIYGSAARSFDEDSLLAYRRHIRTVYGKAPQLSDAVMDLLAKELAGAESDYEKLLRIEAMLSSMNYTRTPGELPSSIQTPRDFADYILLESRKGYCTHYATLFVLLARAAGIPARYVQGYAYTVGSGTTSVMSDTSHAWPEAYIEGFGWLDFEPTPGTGRPSGWSVRKDSENNNSQNVHPVYEEEEEEEESAPFQQRTDSPRQEMHIRFKERWYIPVLLATGFVLLYVVFDLFLRRRSFRRRSEKEKVTWLFQACIRILRSLGHTMAQGETLREFRKRISRSVPEELLAWLFWYEEILYSERLVNEEDTKRFLEARSALLRYRIETLRKHRRNRDSLSDEE